LSSVDGSSSSVRSEKKKPFAVDVVGAFFHSDFLLCTQSELYTQFFASTNLTSLDSLPPSHPLIPQNAFHKIFNITNPILFGECREGEREAEGCGGMLYTATWRKAESALVDMMR
jgi:hypothetical protein